MSLAPQTLPTRTRYHVIAHDVSEPHHEPHSSRLPRPLSATPQPKRSLPMARLSNCMRCSCSKQPRRVATQLIWVASVHLILRPCRAQRERYGRDSNPGVQLLGARVRTRSRHRVHSYCDSTDSECSRISWPDLYRAGSALAGRFISFSRLKRPGMDPVRCENRSAHVRYVRVGEAWRSTVSHTISEASRRGAGKVSLHARVPGSASATTWTLTVAACRRSRS